MRAMNFMPSKRLILSYIFDWIVIVVIAAIGAAFAVTSPYKRPFSLVDLDIQYPYVAKATIPTWLLVVVSIIAPAIIIFMVCLILVPGPTIARSTPRSLVWRRKFWEWNTGWLGLGLSLALAFMFTSGIKNLIGKPRPDMLARCQPDLGAISQNAVGSFAADFSRDWVLVSASICKQTDKSILNDGFRSFPSGHASMSWSGLLYLAFFLCSKFAVSIPFLPPKRLSADIPSTLDAYTGSDESILPVHNGLGQHGSSRLEEDKSHLAGADIRGKAIPARNTAAAPPIYLLALPLVPICTAIYICTTRYFQFFHHGFDILFGAFIGIATSWFAFRYYHLPISQGAGWSWGARSRDRAWAIGVGVSGYVGSEGWMSKKRSRTTGAQAQDPVLGPGLEGREEQNGTKEQTGSDAV